MIMCKKLHLFEYLGTFLIITFVIVVCMDPLATRSGVATANTAGSFTCLLVNFPFILYFFIIKRLGNLVGDIMVYVLH